MDIRIIFSLLVSLLIIIAGTTPSVLLKKRKFYDVLPLSCIGIVLIMFCMGLLNLLRYSGIVLTFLAGGIWIWTIVYVLRKKIEWKCFISPSLLAFCMLYILLFVLNYGHLVYEWDELSHWGFVVKDMMRLDDFQTNPNSIALFSSYPPGMSLFQCFFQYINRLFMISEFVEWQLYFAYQLIIFSCLTPFFINKKVKSDYNIYIYIFSIAVIILSLFTFSEKFMTSLYIDSAVGIVSGIGLALALDRRRNDLFPVVRISFYCAFLCLLKEIGLLFSVIVAAVILVPQLFSKSVWNKHNYTKKEDLISLLLSFGILAVCIIIPRALWKLDMRINNATVQFGNRIDISNFIKVILHGDETYRAVVWTNYIRWLFGQTTHSITILGYTINSYRYMTVLGIAGLFVISTFIYCSQANEGDGIRIPFVLILFFIMTALYLFGLPAMYIYKFSEYEAIRLASIDRYINIYYTCVWVATIIMLSSALFHYRWGVLLFTTMVFMLFIAQHNGLFNIIIKAPVDESIEHRSEWNVISSRILEEIGDSHYKCYLVDQGSTGYNKWVLSFLLMDHFGPHNRSMKWSVGRQPLYEGDIWTWIVEPDVWMDEIAQDRAFVLINCVDDTFIRDYCQFFSITPKEKTLYKVTDRRKLELVCSFI